MSVEPESSLPLVHGQPFRFTIDDVAAGVMRVGQQLAVYEDRLRSPLIGESTRASLAEWKPTRAYVATHSPEQILADLRTLFDRRAELYATDLLHAASVIHDEYGDRISCFRNLLGDTGWVRDVFWTDVTEIRTRAEQAVLAPRQDTP